METRSRVLEWRQSARAEPFPLRGRDVICLSSIDWDFIWQGHQHVMSTLATQGNRVLFVENTGVRRPLAGHPSPLQRGAGVRAEAGANPGPP